MEQQTLKITNVLSDPTRFSIYQYVSKRHKDVTVQEIADKFTIHANVARLHLTKLEDVNMLISETKKSGKGGRPSRFYRISDEVVSIQFPYRDYQKLSELCLNALLDFGAEGQSALNKIGYQYGRESAKSFLLKFENDLENLTIEEKLKYIDQIATNQGLNPNIEYDATNHTASFQIYNCTFKELIEGHADSLCVMHHALIKGIFEYFFGEIKLEEREKITDGCDSCAYTTVFLDK